MKEISRLNADGGSTKPTYVLPYDRPLFKPLPEAIPSMAAQASSSPSFIENSFAMDPQLSLLWKNLEKQFADLIGPDAASTSARGSEADFPRLDAAEAFFSRLVNRPENGLLATGPPKEPITDKTLEGMLKAFVALYQHNADWLFTASTAESVDPEVLPRKIKAAKSLNCFLLILLDSHHKSLIIPKYADILISILLNLIKKAQEGVARVRDMSLQAGILYRLFEALSILAFCSEESSGSSKHRGLLLVYDSFGKLLSNFIMSKELKQVMNVPVAGDEDWVVHRKYPGVSVCAQNGKIKLRLANLGKSPTLGCVLAFYLYKLGLAANSCGAKLDLQSQVQTINTIMTESLALFGECVKLDKSLLPSIFNTNLMVLKLWKKLLEKSEKGEEFVQTNFKDLPRKCMAAHLEATLACGTISKELCEKPRNSCYYKFNHDPVSVIIKILLSLRRKLAFPDGIIVAFQNSVEAATSLSSSQFSLLKAYIVEYFTHEPKTIDLSALLASKLVNFTVPVLSDKKEVPADEHANSLLLATIIDHSRLDKPFVDTIFKTMLERMKSVDCTEEFMSTAFRVLYGILIGRPCHFEALLANSFLRPINTEISEAIEGNPLAIQSFIETLGMTIVFGKVKENAGKELAERMLLLLCEVPELCADWIGIPGAIQWALKTGQANDGRNEFAACLLWKCLSALRDNKKNDVEQEVYEDEGEKKYLPISMMRTIKGSLLGKDNKTEWGLRVYDMVIGFVGHSRRQTLEAHQHQLYFSKEWLQLLDLVHEPE